MVASKPKSADKTLQGPPAASAAQYVRVSTDQQKYTIENQAAALAAYAARRNINIVRTYSDLGRSGLKIAGRDALQELIGDVQRGRADFNCILVYDISRWGRFQDVDESAYYEFICRRAGVNIHYCADEFENDGSLASIVLKNIKRVAAADYSRQLSKKVFLGQARVTTIGHWRGGTAIFGMRRMLVSENGKPRMQLKFGQSKGLKTDYVILVPGPESERKIVREIFSTFARKKKTRTEIANNLNAKGIKNARGLPWSSLTIDNMLKNEVYLGHLVFNRTSAKLGERAVRNPRDMWVRRDNAFKPIISSALFERVQAVRREQISGRRKTDKELLNNLRDLLRKKGHLTSKIMQTAKGVPCDSIFVKRFGSLVGAYKRIGFRPPARYRITEIKDHIDKTLREEAEKLSVELEKRRISATFLPELRLLTINHGLTVGLAVARSISNGTGVSSRRWEIRKRKYTRADLTLIVRMSPSNAKVLDYFLLPTRSLPARYGDRLRISELHFGEFRCDDLQGLLRTLTEWIGTRPSQAN